jgi:hypothetical protein
MEACSIFETRSAVRAIGLIMRTIPPPPPINTDMSNERTFLSIIEQAGEGLEMLRVLSLSDDHAGRAL